MENGGSLITLDLSMLIQVINFLILFYAFWRLFGKKIGPILDERKKIVTSKLAEAEEERVNAKKAVAEAGDLKKEAKKRANEIIIMGLIYSLSINIFGHVFSFSAGWPAFLHVYFDLFTGTIQSFVFVVLSSVYISETLGDKDELETA